MNVNTIFHCILETQLKISANLQLTTKKFMEKFKLK